MQAFQAFAADHPQARLVFIGDGEGRARLEAQRTPNVHVLGSIPDAPQLFAGFDVMLHTARREPFGMVVLEALFAGVPVVTLRQAGPEHILGDLGVYAEADTGHGFAAAMERSLELDRDAYTATGRARSTADRNGETDRRTAAQLRIPDRRQRRNRCDRLERGRE